MKSMGQAARKQTYRGSGQTLQEACTNLQGELRKHVHKEAFVTISDDELRIMSPRAVKEMALCRISGKDYPVSLNKSHVGYQASLYV